MIRTKTRTLRIACTEATDASSSAWFRPKVDRLVPQLHSDNFWIDHPRLALQQRLRTDATDASSGACRGLVWGLVIHPLSCISTSYILTNLA